MQAIKTISQAVRADNAERPDASDLRAELLRRELEALRAENARLKAAAPTPKVRAITVKVSLKGAVSVYGLGRFPVTLYRGQWEKLLSHAEDLKAYIEAHAGELAVKE